jgi:ATP-dependent Lon protease
MRNVARKVATDLEYEPKISPTDLSDILGPATFTPELYQQVGRPGVAVGLAWTQVGGAILFVETSLSKGNGKLILTGNLGDVMKESATTALSYMKAQAQALDLDADQIAKTDVHLHIPEGAIPKDGPSAGITMLTALVSAFTGREVKARLAMTGEITLRGKVLPVGGIKEKILAARRAGMEELILCKLNEKHVAEINADYLKGLTFHYVDTMQEVLDLALVEK